MKILFSAKDPGGKNAIAPVLEALRKRGDEVGEAVTNPDIFIAGTSAGNTPDKEILQSLGKVPSLYVLDFWLNYWQRFSTLGKKDFTFLPTKICVMDDIAKEDMLAEGFDPSCIVVTGNPHFDHFADAVTRTTEEKDRVLFISQPLRATAATPGFAPVASDEYTALSDLIAAVDSLPDSFYISIRLHPKETADKYAAQLGPRVRIAPENTLEEALSASGLIVGISSPVLMQAAAAGKKVLSYEPDLAGPDPLVSNRVGVTTRIDSKEALQSALASYAKGEWPFKVRPLREVWPAGATERVVGAVLALMGEK